MGFASESRYSTPTPRGPAVNRYEAALDEMERAPDGDFILFSDHQADLTRRDEELRECARSIDARLAVVAETAITWTSKLEAERDKAHSAVAQHQRRGDAEQERGNKLEDELDQAKAQALAEVREALLNEEGIRRAARTRFDSHHDLAALDGDPLFEDIDQDEQEDARWDMRLAIEAALSTLEDTQGEGT